MWFWIIYLFKFVKYQIIFNTKFNKHICIHLHNFMQSCYFTWIIWKFVCWEKWIVSCVNSFKCICFTYILRESFKLYSIMFLFLYNKYGLVGVLKGDCKHKLFIMLIYILVCCNYLKFVECILYVACHFDAFHYVIHNIWFSLAKSLELIYSNLQMILWLSMLHLVLVELDKNLHTQ